MRVIHASLKLNKHNMMEATTVKSKRSLRKKADDVSEPVESPSISDQPIQSETIEISVSGLGDTPLKEDVPQNTNENKKDPKNNPKKEAGKIVTIAEEAGEEQEADEDEEEGEEEDEEEDEEEEGEYGNGPTNIQNLLDELIHSDGGDEEDKDEDKDEDGDEDEDEDEDEEEDEGEEESTDFEEDDQTEWPASTVMYMPGVIDEKLVAYFHKYISKDSNKGRIFKPSMTLLIDDEDIDNTDLDESEEIVDESFRKCKVAKDTQTLQKLYNMMEESIDQATDKFIEKFNFFSIVSTKEEFSMLRFEPGDFYKEHIECSSLNDDSDGSSRRICVYIILEAPEKGGVFEFSYQGTKIKPDVGSILMFPSCPLHPLRITKVQSGNLMYVNNFLL